MALQNDYDQTSDPGSNIVIVEPASSSQFGSSQPTPTQTISNGNTSFQTSTSSPGQPSNSASPSPTGNSGGRNDQNRGYQNDSSGSSGLPGHDRRAVIATTTVCGTLILILLVYAIWRKRRGATLSEILLCRPQSQVVTLGSYTDDSRLTALPIYRHNRFSIRSSRHLSGANLSKPPKMAAVPSNLRSWQNRPGTPLVDSASSNAPITPTHKVEWESFLHDASSPQPNTVEHPQDAPTANGDNFLTLPVMRYSSETSATRSTSDRKANNTPGLTLNLSANNESLSPSHTRDDRWSWTNSQAPSTPRIAAPNRRSSLASTRIRNVASWVRNQGRPSDEAKIVKGKKSKPLLKNQAVKPVLAPQAESHVKRSKSSGKHRRVGSLSMIFKPNSPLGAPGPLSPRLEEQRNLKGEAEL